MAISYYFFDAHQVDGGYDRQYSAQDFTDYLEGLVGSGVFPNPSDSLQVYAGTGLQVIVKPGMGWINGHKMTSDADYALTVDAADVTLNRIDRVVFYLDVQNREMGIKIKKGSNASSPTAPELVRTQDMVEYSLCTYTVPRNATAITAAMITDTRLDSDVCGMVQGLIQQVDTSTLYQQWYAGYQAALEENQQDFDTWFNSVKNTIAESVILRTFRNRVVIADSNTNDVSIGISQYVKELDILEVYVNGFRMDTTEYTTDSEGSSVTFTRALDADAVIEFVVYKTINSTGAASATEQIAEILQELLDITTDISNIKTGFKTPTLLHNTTVSPENSTGTVKYENIDDLSSYDIIIIRVSVGASTRTEDKIFFKGTGSGVLTQYISAYANATYNALAAVTCDTTNNRVGIACTYLAGWQLSSIAIREVYGIKL